MEHDPSIGIAKCAKCGKLGPNGLMHAQSDRLFDAARRGDAALLEQLLPVAINREALKAMERDAGGSSLLWTAANFARGKDCAELLIRRGAPVNDPSCPLHGAAQNGRLETAAMLIQNGAIVNAAWSDGTMALHRAAYSGTAEMIRLLLDNGAAINAGDALRFTALHFASKLNDVEKVKVLIARGANVMARTGDAGMTPLHWASINGQVAVATVLMKNGADPNAKTFSGATPLALAARRGIADKMAPVLRRRAWWRFWR